ncbi:DUF6029 family protein [Psychroserpens sp.]|uniref:DUF6029 family protein n=1 Tax=Psychroserpens sp. TaxID=2020870 RepID=UPI001B131BE6|nr:DUF6029 family protein [Psychroserpens sp.]MBO6605898.1 hypothetical protein [Psychroserpens sp.]MBO6630673.1 hypothetical protein [Psychroserpens sp.]MBO6652731.1 hypothetical protein [Psychroserpens sp.]MBO6681497.1 hypothetical protein [Psychroserpens sp.]MBO6749272.1 hypothetical protein [Psychroserpens sp.]
MNRYSLLALLLTIPFISQSQDLGKLSGGFESLAQYYIDDPKTGDFEEEDPFRSNNYLRLNYDYKNWFAHVQVESYEPNAILNFYPKYQGTDVGTFALGYRSSKLEVTLGHIYEQYGSGLALRTWEDRQIGVNNAIRGANVKYRPTKDLEFSALVGRMRDGFEVSDGTIFGFNAEVGLSSLFKFESTGLDLGFSYVGRDEDLDIDNPNFESLTNVYSMRLDLTEGSIYSSLEYVIKGEDVYSELGNIIEDRYFDGGAVLFNFGFAKSGLGIDATFRRMENMANFSERDESANVFNQNFINFIPGLTKQHDYGLTNIYVYQAQPRLTFNPLFESGEIGGQIDIFYNIKKGTKLGGKYGTKLAFNFASWSGLKGDFNITERTYEDTDFFGFGEKYFEEFSLDVRKKWTPKWSSIFSVVQTFYNARFIEDRNGEVNATAIVGEVTRKFDGGKSIRAELSHLFSNDELPERAGDWAGGTLEYNFNSNISLFATDIWNYGNPDENRQVHYYTFGGSFTKGATRIMASYGRQRGGLVCIGGICRFVPENTGFSLSVSTSF